MDNAPAPNPARHDVTASPLQPGGLAWVLGVFALLLVLFFFRAVPLALDPPRQTNTPDDRARIDNRGEPIVEGAAKVADSPQCTTARLNASLLSGTSAVQQDTDGDGKPDKILGQDDRANQRALAEAAMKAYCAPAANAGG